MRPSPKTSRSSNTRPGQAPFSHHPATKSRTAPRNGAIQQRRVAGWRRFGAWHPFCLLDARVSGRGTRSACWMAPFRGVAPVLLAGCAGFGAGYPLCLLDGAVSGRGTRSACWMRGFRGGVPALLAGWRRFGAWHPFCLLDARVSGRGRRNRSTGRSPKGDKAATGPKRRRQPCCPPSPRARSAMAPVMPATACAAMLTAASLADSKFAPTAAPRSAQTRSFVR